MPVVVKQEDHGASELIKRLAGRATVRVGIQGQKAEEAKTNGKGLTVADVGSFHEFGLGNNPRRSFIADFVDENIGRLETRLVRLCKKIVSGKMDLVTALNQFGVAAQGEIQERIARGIPPPLAEATLKKKGEAKSTPLIDTGQLRSSVTYEVIVGKAD